MSQPIPSFDTVSSKYDFPYLMSILRRYQQHVHYLEDPVAPRVLSRAEERLGMKIPPSLRNFYLRWNGADLFMSHLQIREVMQLTAVSRKHKHIILFAYQEEGTKWAYAEDGRDGFVFGIWKNEQFLPLFSSFTDWLKCGLHYFSEGPFLDPWKERYTLAEGKAYLQLHRARQLLREDQLALATEILQEISLEQVLIPARIALGDALYHTDREASANCYQEALQLLSFPLPYQEYVPSIDWLDRLEEQLPTEVLYDELLALWNHRMESTRTVYECQIIEKIALIIARLSFQKAWNAEGEERSKHLSFILGFSKTLEIKGAGFLIEAREKLVSWGLDYYPYAIQLEIARMYFFYGEYDWAEQRLRSLYDAPPALQHQRDLLIGRIICQQKENWGLDILFPLLDAAEDPRILSEVCLLSARYYLQFGDQVEALQALEEAESFAGEFEDTRLDCEFLIIQGLLATEQNLINYAFELFAKAQKKATEAQDVLLYGEALVHMGDIYRRSLGDDKAIELYQEAESLFCEYHCRFGWERVSLKLGELAGNGSQLLEVYKIAKDISDVQGVLQAEKALRELQFEYKEPSLLSWFLQEIRTRQGERASAQRCKAPFIRKDADRPERRLGNLRKGFSLCDVSILDELEEKILFYLPKLQESELSSSNHDLLAFMAALDLVNSHPSSKAVEIILKIIERGNLFGLAKEGFVQILSRTKNIPVSIGLLSFLENPESSFDTRIMAVEILGWRREEAAIPFLIMLLHDTKSSRMRREVVKSLGRIRNRKVVPELLRHTNDTQISGELSLALLLLGEHSALDWHAQSLAAGMNRKNVHLGSLVGRYGGSAYLLLLRNITQGDEEPEILKNAVHGLGYLGDPSVVPFLINLTGLREETISKAASEALELITGHYEGTEEFLLRRRWEEWWRLNQHNFESGVRYRLGKLMSPALLIHSLKNDDLLERLSAYDELVISTGVQLGFDPEGDWWLQKKQIAKWEKWWDENQNNFEEGKWYFDGKAL